MSTGEYWDRHRVSTKERAWFESRATAATARSARADAASLLPWRTVRDAISDLTSPTLSGSRKWLNHQLQPGARSYPGHTGSLMDHPAKALKAGVRGVPGGENMLRRSDGSVRYFTVRESARLQTFPDRYALHGPWGEAMRQLGNAVPVLVTANPTGLKTREDLIPIPIAFEAARRYVRSFVGEEGDKKLAKLRVDAIVVAATGVHAALEKAFQSELGPQFHLDKVGLSRNVVELLAGEHEDLADHSAQLTGNFRELFNQLGSKQRLAMRELRQEKAGRKITRLRTSFFKDFPVGGSREHGLLLFEELASVIDERWGAEALVRELSALRRKHDLEVDVSHRFQTSAPFGMTFTRLRIKKIATLKWHDRADRKS